MEKKKHKILVIEDDLSMAKVLDKWLKVFGCDIVKTYKGETGLNAAKMEAPDLILLDLMLPDIGGVEVAKRLKQEASTKDIPIIFMTAYMGVEMDKGDEKIEIDGQLYTVFAKPLHNRKLLSEIRKTINRRIHGNDS